MGGITSLSYLEKKYRAKNMNSRKGKELNDVVQEEKLKSKKPNVEWALHGSVSQ